ncbi:hypothetical protein ASZ78_004717 [Callipepla squamata]|uniref:Uncharacterized protein n=1 Tax=Callipepla squamata TaxID=9009 RepID=A0A226NK32_CALSU|nr:hypothetical protein ASZ78_004717 [Callipepla squamata]
MSTAMNFSAKSFKPRPPDKGSFPLDHFGALPPGERREGPRPRAQPGGSAAPAVQLMANEPLEKLGFKDLISEASEAKPGKL